jgi:peptidoglycan hydrolase-like protein with peptidoglycan-binding domain
MTKEAARTLTSARINAILGTSPSAPTVKPPANLRTLRLVNPFMRGEDVKFAQTKMGELKADGVFGPNTDKRTRDFQKENRLKVDGIIGPSTWRVIISA